MLFFISFIFLFQILIFLCLSLIVFLFLLLILGFRLFFWPKCNHQLALLSLHLDSSPAPLSKTCHYRPQILLTHLSLTLAQMISLIHPLLLPTTRHHLQHQICPLPLCLTTLSSLLLLHPKLLWLCFVPPLSQKIFHLSLLPRSLLASILWQQDLKTIFFILNSFLMECFVDSLPTLSIFFPPR